MIKIRLSCFQPTQILIHQKDYFEFFNSTKPENLIEKNSIQHLKKVVR